MWESVHQESQCFILLLLLYPIENVTWNPLHQALNRIQSCTFLKQYISPSIEVSLKVAGLACGNDCHTFLMGTVTLTPRVLRAVPGNPLTSQSPVKRKQRTKLNYTCQASFSVKHTALGRSSGKPASSSSGNKLLWEESRLISVRDGRSNVPLKNHRWVMGHSDWFWGAE